MKVSETDWQAVAERVESVRDIARAFAGTARTHFGNRLRDIRLFGSAARGDWQEGSDVDVLVLLDTVKPQDRRWIAEHATQIGILGSGVLISTVTLPVSEFERLRQRERLFAREIDAQGIAL